MDFFFKSSKKNFYEKIFRKISFRKLLRKNFRNISRTILKAYKTVNEEQKRQYKGRKWPHHGTTSPCLISFPQPRITFPYLIALELPLSPLRFASSLCLIAQPHRPTSYHELSSKPYHMSSSSSAHLNGLIAPLRVSSPLAPLHGIITHSHHPQLLPMASSHMRLSLFLIASPHRT